MNAFAQTVKLCDKSPPPPGRNRRVPPPSTTAGVWTPFTCTSTPVLLMAAERRCVPPTRRSDAGIRSRVKLAALPRTAKATTWSHKGKNTALFHVFTRLFTPFHDSQACPVHECVTELGNFTVWTVMWVLTPGEPKIHNNCLISLLINYPFFLFWFRFENFEINAGLQRCLHAIPSLNT